jgi:hypothetical protein
MARTSPMEGEEKEPWFEAMDPSYLSALGTFCVTINDACRIIFMHILCLIEAWWFKDSVSSF